MSKFQELTGYIGYLSYRIKQHLAHKIQRTTQLCDFIKMTKKFNERDICL